MKPSTAMRLLAFLVLSCAQARAHQPHYVKSLPGYPGRLPVRLHSGYIALNSSAKKLFYILTESAQATDDPLVRSFSITLRSLAPEGPQARGFEVELWHAALHVCMRLATSGPPLCRFCGSTEAPVAPA